MTNLNAVNIGMNKYCGPAVLSILTGKSTDECARVISSINGSYKVAGVQLNDLLKAADKLGFDQLMLPAAGSMYGTLVMHSNNDGMYIFTLPNHFVCIEINNKKIYFCDNHTKEPIPAGSSARLQQKVLGVHKVIRRPEVVIPLKPKTKPEVETGRVNTLEERLMEVWMAHDLSWKAQFMLKYPDGLDPIITILRRQYDG